MNFEEELSGHVTEVENIIQSFLPEETGYQKRVIEAMNYSFLAGGKRLRPMFMLESYRLFGGVNEDVVKPFMAAMEMIHTYSLIHDDLPAMDNDDFRRGRLTNHKKFDEATAILAGDSLLNYAFETMLASVAEENDNSLRTAKSKAAFYLAKSAGIYGMIGGQMVDIESEKKGSIPKEELLFIHENKTAALIKASLCVGAILAGADEKDIAKMERVGYLIGVAFQIQDDILDCIGDDKILGKPVGSDAKNEKTTYVTLEGLEKAMEDERRMSEEAIHLLEEVKGNSEFLVKLVESLIKRNK